MDAGGKLFGKHAFTDIVGLKDAIVAEKDIFARAFIKHLLAYSLGRELTLSDRIAVDEIAEASKKDNYKMRNVIKNVVLHPLFSQRSAE